jgi:60 kDa SS-A/Ro ribonucleoprotein
MSYLKRFTTRRTPQHEPIPGAGQVPNSAGGYAWAVDDWQRLDRFLILGSEGGSYYASERQLTAEAAAAVRRCIEADGTRAVERIVAVSEGGRAPKNDPALFALALAAAYADDAGRRAALDALPRVARTGTHLLHFAAYVEGFRGWGRGLRRAVATWYEGRAERDLAYQLVKYAGRDGWSHRDLLRLSHPKPTSEARRILYGWTTQGWPGVGDEPHPDEALRLLWAADRAKRATTVWEIVWLIREFGLPREAVPTEWLRDAAVWEALLPAMPIGATIRNLATMTRLGLLAPGGDATRTVVARLGDGERLRRARIHPIAVLASLKTYAAGRGQRGKATWQPVGAIVDALDGAFYAAFGAVPATGKRWTIAVDVSGSMDGGAIAGVPGLTPRVAAGALALLTASTERDYTIEAFTAAKGGFGGQWGGGDPALTPLTLSPRQRLDDVTRAMAALPMGGTDCSLPIRWATARRLETDVFMVLTDNETWAGKVHPAQALREYRQKINPHAKLVVAGLVANDFTIADPNDAGMLDVVGFDTAAPTVIADFATGGAGAAPTTDEE